MNTQVQDLADGIGEFIEYWGFKKIHGKIWALVFLSEAPVDANYLMKNLGVSKSLVSMSIKDLLHYNVIQEAPDKKSTVKYVSNKDLATVITDVLMAREAKMLLKIKASCELVKRLEPGTVSPYVDRKKLKSLERMISAADKALKALITLKQMNLSELSEVMNLNKSKQGALS